MKPLTVLTVPGSLRQGSYNRSLLSAATTVAPATLQLRQADLHDVPLFDEDREDVDQGGPVVQQLRRQVGGADALLVATPEYNQSIPGVLKNAIDWLSRPTPQRVLDGKPVAVIGATPGPWGTRLAQQATRHTLAATGCIVMTSPSLFVRDAANVFDDGLLVDDATASRLGDVVTALEAWTRALASGYPA